MKYVKLKPISLKDYSQLNERWLQEIIAKDPAILGIGNVILKDKERTHSGGGRLDLLFQDADGYDRYEVEIQLGPTDASHIVRTIEYWDIERRRYPQYEHIAVIVAENITGRFFNVVHLFNQFIPLIAIQVSAFETPDGVGLLFTKVLDTVEPEYIDEDEEPTDRRYWETKGTPETVGMADKILELCRQFIPSAELNYNKHYIGFRVEGRACNFAICRPQKSALRLKICLPQSEETDEYISSAEFDFLDYDRRMYRLRLTAQDLSAKSEALVALLEQAYELRKQG